MTREKQKKRRKIAFFQRPHTCQNCRSPLVRAMVPNSRRRTTMVHLLKLYWSTSRGLKWDVLSPSGKQLSAAASSRAASSLRKKRTAFRKADSSPEAAHKQRQRVPGTRGEESRSGASARTPPTEHQVGLDDVQADEGVVAVQGGQQHVHPLQGGPDAEGARQVPEGGLRQETPALEAGDQKGHSSLAHDAVHPLGRGFVPWGSTQSQHSRAQHRVDPSDTRRKEADGY